MNDQVYSQLEEPKIMCYSNAYPYRSSPDARFYALEKLQDIFSFTCTTYIICRAKSEDEMMDNLWIVLAILSENNLKIQLTETKFFQTQVKISQQIFFNSVGGKIHSRKSKPERSKDDQRLGAYRILKVQWMPSIEYISS